MQLRFHIIKVFISESEESLQPDPGPARNLHACMATPKQLLLIGPGGLRRVLSQPAEPGERDQTVRLSKRGGRPRH